MYGDEIVRIKKASNGYIVEVRDPEIVKANRKRDKLKYDSAEYRAAPAYRSPEREFVMKDKEAVTTFLKGIIDKLVPEGNDGNDDFSSSFDAAVAEANGDDEEE